MTHEYRPARMLQVPAVMGQQTWMTRNGSYRIRNIGSAHGNGAPSINTLRNIWSGIKRRHFPVYIEG